MISKSLPALFWQLFLILPNDWWDIFPTWDAWQRYGSAFHQTNVRGMIINATWHPCVLLKSSPMRSHPSTTVQRLSPFLKSELPLTDRSQLESSGDVLPKWDPDKALPSRGQHTAHGQSMFPGPKWGQRAITMSLPARKLTSLHASV